MTHDAAEFEQRIGQIESLLESIDAIAEPLIREQMQDVLAAILDYHGEALTRMVTAITVSDGVGNRDALVRWAEDPLVASLLVLYDLHPQATEQRVRDALESVRPYLESHGGNVELISITADTARLRMQGSCDGCPSSALTAKHTIEKAIFESAPEIRWVLVEGVADSTQVDSTQAPKVLVQLGSPATR